MRLFRTAPVLRSSPRLLPVVLATVLLCAAGQSVEAGGPTTGPAAPEIRPEPVIQFAVDRVARTVREEDFYRNLALLVEAQRRSGADGAELVRQIAWYMSRSDNRDPQAIGIAVYTYRLLGTHCAPDDQVLALAPYLGAADDRLREIAVSILFASTGVSVDENGEYPEFRAFVAYLQGHPAAPPAPVALYLFQCHPRAALYTLMKVYMAFDDGERRRLIDGDVTIHAYGRTHPEASPQQIEQARLRQLDALSRDKRWWVRLYAAAMVRRHKELRRPDLIERLRRDEHPYVRIEADRPKNTRFDMPPPNSHPKTHAATEPAAD